jgi:hypothetical protein
MPAVFAIDSLRFWYALPIGFTSSLSRLLVRILRKNSIWLT